MCVSMHEETYPKRRREVGMIHNSPGQSREAPGRVPRKSQTLALSLHSQKTKSWKAQTVTNYCVQANIYGTIGPLDTYKVKCTRFAYMKNYHTVKEAGKRINPEITQMLTLVEKDSKSSAVIIFYCLEELGRAIQIANKTSRHKTYNMRGKIHGMIWATYYTPVRNQVTQRQRY